MSNEKNDKSKVTFTPIGPGIDPGGFQMCPDEVCASYGYDAPQDSAFLIQSDDDSCYCANAGSGGDPHVSTFFNEKYDM